MVLEGCLDKTQNTFETDKKKKNKEKKIDMQQRMSYYHGKNDNIITTQYLAKVLVLEDTEIWYITTVASTERRKSVI